MPAALAETAEYSPRKKASQSPLGKRKATPNRPRDVRVQATVSLAPITRLWTVAAEGLTGSRLQPTNTHTPNAVASSAAVMEADAEDGCRYGNEVGPVNMSSSGTRQPRTHSRARNRPIGLTIPSSTWTRSQATATIMKSDSR